MKVRTLAFYPDAKIKHVIEREIKSLDSEPLRRNISFMEDLTELENPNQGGWKIIQLQIQEEGGDNL